MFSKKDAVILIPARLESSRFPYKTLVSISDEESLIQRVYRKCYETGYDTFVVTDSEEISKQVPQSIIIKEAKNGTERCLKALQNLNYSCAVNVQADMIDIESDVIDSFIEDLSFMKPGGVLTGYTEFNSEEERESKSTVKIAHTPKKDFCFKRAFYFTRQNIPGSNKHVGIYGFVNNNERNRNSFPFDYLRPNSSYEESLEEIEDLEQLRWLDKGYEIYVTKVDYSGFEINTKNDLARWKYENTPDSLIEWTERRNKNYNEGGISSRFSGPIGKPESKINPESGFSNQTKIDQYYSVQQKRKQ